MLLDDVALAVGELEEAAFRARTGDPWGTVNCLLSAQNFIARAIVSYVTPETFTAREKQE